MAQLIAPTQTGCYAGKLPVDFQHSKSPSLHILAHGTCCELLCEPCSTDCQSYRSGIPSVARTSLSRLIRPSRCLCKCAKLLPFQTPAPCSACTRQNGMWLRRAATGLLAGYQRHAAAAAAGGTLPPAPPAAVAALQQACQFSSRRSEGPGGVSAFITPACTTTASAMPAVAPLALPSVFFCRPASACAARLCHPSRCQAAAQRCLFISFQMHNTLP